MSDSDTRDGGRTLEDFAKAADGPEPEPDTAGWKGPTWTPRVVANVDGNPIPPLDWMSPINYRPDKRRDPRFKRPYPSVKAPRRLFDLELRPDMWPQTGFLRRYMDVVTPTTDAPLPFHLATALVSLATALGPRWTIQHRTGGLAANLWFLLVADSGSRKSTAMKMVTRLLPESRVWIGAIESTRCFMEAYCEQWESNVLWWFDEATGFLDALDKPYTRDLASRLTTAFDGDPISYQSVATKRQLLVTRPYLSLLTGTPLAWLRARRISSDILRGGVFGRALLIPAAKKAADCKVSPPPLDPVATENLRRWLLMLAEQPGDYHLTLGYDAEQTYINWYAVTEQSGNEELALAGVWNRRGDFVLKLALLYHVASLRSPKQAVQPDSIEQAISFLHYYVFPGQLWALNRLVDVSPNMRAMLDIEERLESTPQGIRYAAIPREFGLQPDQAQKVLYALWRDERLEFWQLRDPTVNHGRPVFIVARAGDDLDDPDLHPEYIARYLKRKKPSAIQKLQEKLNEADDLTIMTVTDTLRGENELDEDGQDALPEWDDT